MNIPYSLGVKRPEFQGYVFTGPLRPGIISPRRTVPPHIKRPDYADDPEGIPHSEMRLKSGNTIPVYTAEQIKGIREACRVRLLSFHAFF